MQFIHVLPIILLGCGLAAAAPTHYGQIAPRAQDVRPPPPLLRAWTSDAD